MDEEDEGVSAGGPGDGWSDDSEGDPIRGWISPDDRLWRHPSESNSSADRSGTEWPARSLGPPRRLGPAHARGPGETTLSPGRSRPAPWVIGGATACVAVALLATGLVMATGSGDPDTPPSQRGTASLTGAPTTEPGVGRTARTARIESMVSAIRPSTVALTIERPGGTTVGTGLVAEAGGIIVTMAAPLSGARSIWATEPDGSRQPAGLVGIDRTSDLAVLRIADDLPAATFDADDPPTGTVATAVTLEPVRRSRATPASQVYAGTVLSSGQPSDTDATTTRFSATTVRTPLHSANLGCPLLDDDGDVSGLLEKTMQSGGSTTAIFLPAELVVGVARQLVSSGAVDHGWLGLGTAAPSAGVPLPSDSQVAVDATDPPPSQPARGALVDSITSGSPADLGGLAVGDTIVGIDGHLVQSPAELWTRLYADPPGTAVAVTYQRAGATMSTSVVLDDNDDDAQGNGPSP